MTYTPRPITGWQRLTLACGCIKEIPVKDDDPYEVHEDYYCDTPSAHDATHRQHGLVIVARAEDLSGDDIVRRVRVDADLEFVFFRDGSAGMLSRRDGKRVFSAEQWKELVGA